MSCKTTSGSENTFFTTPTFFVPSSIEEDSTTTKVLSCIPFLGIYVSYNCESSLNNKINQEQNCSKKTKLIDIKNQYIAAAIICNLLSAAVIIAGIACGIFNHSLAKVLSPITFCGLAGFNAYRINQNNQTISDLKRSGFSSRAVL